MQNVNNQGLQNVTLNNLRNQVFLLKDHYRNIRNENENISHSTNGNTTINNSPNQMNMQANDNQMGDSSVLVLPNPNSTFSMCENENELNLINKSIQEYDIELIQCDQLHTESIGQTFSVDNLQTFDNLKNDVLNNYSILEVYQMIDDILKNDNLAITLQWIKKAMGNPNDDCLNVQMFRRERFAKFWAIEEQNCTLCQQMIDFQSKKTVFTVCLHQWDMDCLEEIQSSLLGDNDISTAKCSCSRILKYEDIYIARRVVVLRESFL